VKLYVEKSQRDKTCLNISRVSRFSVWLVFGVPVVSEEFFSVVKDDSDDNFRWAYKLLIRFTVCLLML